MTTDDTANITWPRYCHPVEQAALWVGEIPLYDWQVDTLVAAAVPHSRVCVSALNESGKTNLVAIIFLCSVAAAFPKAKCYATSGNEQQLSEQLWEILKGLANKRGWNVKASNMEITLPNRSVIRCNVRRDAESVEGVHGYKDENGIYCPVAYFIDEAKHVSNAKQFAVRRIDPDFYLAMSTPPAELDVQMDWFWNGINYDDLDKTIMKRRADFHIEEPRTAWDKRIADILNADPVHSFDGEYFTYRRIVTWKQSEVPHLFTMKKKRERENIEKQFGRNSAYVQSMLYGVASAGTSINPIFSEEEVGLMRRAMGKDAEFKAQHGDIRAAADVSGTGEGDPMVFAVRCGTEVLDIIAKTGLDDVGQAEWLVTTNKALNIQPYQFCIDNGGVGSPIANRMEQTLGYHGVTRFQANCDPTFEYQFYDRYTELHWVIKELLSYRAVTLPWCPLLLRDMRERRYTDMAGEGKIKCEDKKAHRKRVGHSPDYLDLMVYLFADLPIDKIRRGLSLMRQSEQQRSDADRPWTMRQHEKPIQSRIFTGLHAQPSLREIQQQMTGRRMR